MIDELSKENNELV